MKITAEDEPEEVPVRTELEKAVATRWGYFRSRKARLRKEELTEVEKLATRALAANEGSLD
jgi:hypothetical protein